MGESAAGIKIYSGTQGLETCVRAAAPRRATLLPDAACALSPTHMACEQAARPQTACTPRRACMHARHHASMGTSINLLVCKRTSIDRLVTPVHCLDPPARYVHACTMLIIPKSKESL